MEKYVDERDFKVYIDNFLIILIKYKTTQETTNQQQQTLIENQPCSIQNEAQIPNLDGNIEFELQAQGEGSSLVRGTIYNWRTKTNKHIKWKIGN